MVCTVLIIIVCIHSHCYVYFQTNSRYFCEKNAQHLSTHVQSKLKTIVLFLYILYSVLTLFKLRNSGNSATPRLYFC